jgi:hypothetical protein
MTKIKYAATDKFVIQTRNLFSIAIIMISSISVGAQTDLNEGRFKFYSFKFHSGRHLYTGQQLSDKLKNGYAAIEFRAGWQSKGKQQWQKELNYPSYGVGLYNGYIGDVDIFGSPHAIFGFMTFHASRIKRNSWQIEPAIGVTYNLKPYNAKMNPINDASGAKVAIYLSLHAGGKYRLNRELDFLYGVDITHFSNGRTFTPNLGLNMWGFSSGIRYNFNADQKKLDDSEHPTKLLEARPTFGSKLKPSPIRETNLSFYQAVGTVQNSEDAGTNHRYLVTSSVIELQHKFNTKHAVTAGFDAFVDPSATDTTDYPLNKEKLERFFPGAHIGYDFMFWKLLIRFQIGVHLSSIGRTLKGNTFVRPAIRYEINKRLFGQFGLKTRNGAEADFAEIGLGYKIFYQSRKKPY